MAERVIPLITPQQARHRFEACAIAFGYAHDSGRARVSEVFQEDFLPLLTLMGTESERENILDEILSSANPWIKYQAAILMVRYSLNKASAALSQLTAIQTSNVAWLSDMALLSLKDRLKRD